MDFLNPPAASQPQLADTTVSVSPSGERFPLPDERAYEEERSRLAGLAAEHKAQGREVFEWLIRGL